MIVMLTRLNENSVKMCHCYWPTSNQASSNCPQATPQTGSSSPPLSNSGANGDKQPPVAGNGAVGKRNSSSSGQSASVLLGNTTNAYGFGNGALTSPPINGAGRRSSVTSVFSLAGNRNNNGNNQPIIANRDLNNNVLCFDISHDCASPSSIDEATIEEDTPPTTTTKTTTDNKDSLINPTQQLSKLPNSSFTKFEVHLVSEHVSSNDFLVRNMCLINRSTGETRTITQFHYLSWPEMGVPVNVKSLLQFRRKVHKSYRNLKSPILVHCSDGTGRSGTYTLIDIILDRIKNGAKEIDPRATLEHLRDQRTGLCATKAQFAFVLMALAEEIQIILNALPQ